MTDPADNTQYEPGEPARRSRSASEDEPTLLDPELGASLREPSPVRSAPQRTRLESAPGSVPPAPDESAHSGSRSESPDETLVKSFTSVAAAEEHTLVDEHPAPEGPPPGGLSAQEATLLMPAPPGGPAATVVEPSAIEPPTIEGSTVTEPGRGTPAAGDSQTGASASGGDGTHSGGTSGATTFESSTIAAAGRRMGFSARYELVEDFARGGLGRIWRARDLRIRREVACKELLPKALRNPEIVERFLDEAQVTGQLEHPGIVPVYDLGWREDGTPYYCMKLVRGVTLRDAIRHYHALSEDGGGRLAFVRLLRQFVAVCQAVAFAHDRGVLHRDLKPLNVMLGDFGETLVLDWGMAKILETEDRDVRVGEDAGERPAAPDPDRDATLIHHERSQASGHEEDGTTRAETSRTNHAASHGTRSFRSRRSVSTSARSPGSETEMGSIMGTPNYMSPEQALGLVPELDPRSDVYALGAILYEILTGEPPVPKGNLSEKLRHIVHGTVAPPRSLKPVPRPLEAVCLKALAKLKENRYPSALALAADVEAFLADEPVTAWPEPWHLRLRRWGRRHRTLVTSAAAVLAVAVAGGVTWSGVENRRLESRRRAAEAILVEARDAAGAADFAQAASLLRDAAASVRGEGALSALASGIGAELEHVERLRLARLRQEAERKLSEAARALRERQDHAGARSLLTEALALVGREPELVDLRDSAAAQRAAVEADAAAREERRAAQAQFARFQQMSDQARFHGGLFQGESVDDDVAEAQQQALAALRLYGLDEAVPPQSPPHLDAQQWTELRHEAFELLLLLAEAETLSARHRTIADQRAALERSAEWLSRARGLGIVSHALAQREAGCFERLGRTAERDAAREEADRVPPSTPLDLFLAAEAARKDRDFSRALADYDRTLRADPDHFWAMHFQALCRLQLEDYTAAIAGYTACVGRRPEFVWNYVARGAAYGEVGEADAALDDFERAAELAPDLPGVFINRGAVFTKLERFDEAIAEFQRAAALRPDFAGPRINLGEVYRRQAQQVRESQGLSAALPLFQQAVEELTAAAALAPGNPAIYRIRGDVHRRLEDFDLALRDFRRLAEFEPSPAGVSEAYRWIGEIYHFLGRWEPALESYEDALARTPDDAELHYLRGEVLLRLNRHPEAVAAFSRQIELSEPLAAGAGESRRAALREQVADAYAARGAARARLRRHRDAVNDYTRFLELQPAANVLTQRGWAYVNYYRELALEDFEEAIALNDEDSHSYAGRGYVKALLGDPQGAVEDAEMALRQARKFRDRGASIWPLFYNPATVYAQAVVSLAREEAPSEEREQLTAEWTARAVEAVAEAWDQAGPAMQPILLEALDAESGLEPIRSRPEFQELRKRLREEG